MLKSLDVLIGATTVLLIVSMAVTVITQAFTSLMGRRGKHLKDGLSDLLQQLGVSDRNHAQNISDQILRHPLVAEAGGKLGSVVHREEFTKLLLGFAANQGGAKLNPQARESLNTMLKNNGVSDPEQSLDNIAALALQLEASNPELANHVRDRLAILHGAGSRFVARVNSWFDQTIDRVGQRFTYYTHGITVAIALIVVFGLQVNIVTVVNRLSADDQLRQAAVANAMKINSSTPPTGSAAQQYSQFLENAGIVSVPTWDAPVNWQKVPEILLTALLVSLGAPFWYNALKDLLRLRSSLAQKDEQQRTERQTSSPAEESGAANAKPGVPSWLHGERGEMTVVG